MTTAVKFYIPDMTCNHCVKTLTTTIQNKDHKAQLEIDLIARQLSIKTANDPATIEKIIKEAGFTPQRI